jgi:putative peptidoglycan lipid II flippase
VDNLAQGAAQLPAKSPLTLSDNRNRVPRTRCSTGKSHPGGPTLTKLAQRPLIDEAAHEPEQAPLPGPLRVVTFDPKHPVSRGRDAQKIAAHAGRASVGILFSRVIGLVREQMIAAWFGAGLATDAFNVAFRIPNLLRDLFIEGALPSLFVPVFTNQRKIGEEESRAFVRQLTVTLFSVSLVLCTLGWVFAPAICRALAPGFAAMPGKLEMSVSLMRAMLPLIPAVTIAAVGSGVLNASSRFMIPAMTPALQSMGVIGGIALLTPLAISWGKPGITSLAWGVVLGGVLMVVFQMPALHKMGFRFRLEWPRFHPAVVRLGVMMVPALVGLAAVNLNLFATTFFASMMPQGSVSWLWFAYRVVQLPAGVIGSALATVSLTSFANSAKDGNMKELKNTLCATLRLMFTLTIPAGLWLAVMAGPVTTLLFRYGAFTAHDTAQTASALRMYCLGLPAIAACGVFTRAFYALGDSATPVRAMIVSALLGLGMNALVVVRPLGFGPDALALSTTLVMILNLSLLRKHLDRKLGSIGDQPVVRVALKTTLASVVALVPSMIALALLGEPTARWSIVLFLGASAASTAAMGWWLSNLFGGEELPILMRAFRSGLVRRAAPQT